MHDSRTLRENRGWLTNLLSDTLSTYISKNYHKDCIKDYPFSIFAYQGGMKCWCYGNFCVQHTKSMFSYLEFAKKKVLYPAKQVKRLNNDKDLHNRLFCLAKLCSNKKNEKSQNQDLMPT